MLVEVCILIVIIGVIVFIWNKNRQKPVKPVESKKEMNDDDYKRLMEYVSLLNKVFNKLRSTSIYREEYSGDAYYIEKEFKTNLSTLAETYINKEDIPDINFCENILKKFNELSYDFNLDESISREDLLKVTFRKFKDTFSNNVKNKVILNPLCILLAIKYNTERHIIE